MTSDSSRLYVVDALRGFAIVAIMLLHNIEHFDLYFKPEGLAPWMMEVDQVIWDTLFFLFGGKAYAMFALLFGLTFFIQSDNQRKRGQDFSARFAWRLVLLFMFGIINSAFFEGDILMIYAGLGFLLIPAGKLSNKAVLIIAIIFFLQPLEMVNLYYAIQNPDVMISDPESWSYFGIMHSYTEGTSFIDTIVGNITNGRKAVLLWNWENGRFFHIVSLFLFGMLAGRLNLFTSTDENRKFWKKVLFISTVLFVPLFAIQWNLEKMVSSDIILRSLSTIETSWTNIAFMVIQVSGFYLLFQKVVAHRVLNVFSPIGKMSLSNYIIQSIIGTAIYHGYGLGLFRYTGATYCLLIGLVLSVLMWSFCKWWMSGHRHGPLEKIWHKLTWVGTDK